MQRAQESAYLAPEARARIEIDKDRSARAESDRFRRFSYDDLVQRDKASLDLICLAPPADEGRSSVDCPPCRHRHSPRDRCSIGAS